MTPLAQWIYPELRQLPEPDRAAALRRASRGPFDFLELLGIAASLVLVTVLTRYSAAGLPFAERLGLAVANFVVAIPLLVATVAPFHVRRVRRGLRFELRRDGTGSAG